MKEEITEEELILIKNAAEYGIETSLADAPMLAKALGKYTDTFLPRSMYGKVVELLALGVWIDYRLENTDSCTIENVKEGDSDYEGDED